MFNEPKEGTSSTPYFKKLNKHFLSQGDNDQLVLVVLIIFDKILCHLHFTLSWELCAFCLMSISLIYSCVMHML